eukprot:GFUD01029755.1.p2 GENE.GFUD01029755.1~~GFUD01029755.1.p2  ORF type:complete len:215 (+),score=54.63 GFUD01029755.1:400-1044(+)
MSQITEEQFISHCSQFIPLSEAAGDNWDIVEDGTTVWLHRETVQTVARQRDVCEDGLSESLTDHIAVKGKLTGTVDITDVDSTIDITVDDDNEIFINSLNTELISCSYEVHYSPSYAVPVLYCRFWNCSGQLLGMEQVWSLVPLPARGWDKVSMAPHPVTGMPWVQVHPCKTGQVAGLMRSSSDISKCNYIVTFLSLYGQAVGLNMSTEYASRL